MSNPERFKSQVIWLGYLGLAPLIVGFAFVVAETAKPVALDFVKSYAAIILAFIGAIHWGRAMTSSQTGLMVVSVLPSLYASICLLLPAVIALPLLAIGFLLVLIFDYQQYREILWFQRMRIQLTVMVTLLLVFSWIFVNK